MQAVFSQNNGTYNSARSRSRNFLLSLAFLFVSGAADNVSAVIRSTLLQILVPHELLGRVSSVNAIFIGSSNELGAFESGVAAKLLGVVPSVLFGGAITLAVVLVTGWTSARRCVDCKRSVGNEAVRPSSRTARLAGRTPRPWIHSAMSADLLDQLQQTLTGTYVLERELGGGGMSRVFVATETALDRKVVIKVLPLDLGFGVSVDRFKREIQLAAQLQHPHILGLLSAGETNGMPYYTMPFVDGLSLRTRLETFGALPIRETISILRDVAKALAYAHDRGVVHRDIKPDNVLTTSGSAVVTDFGIAKALAAARSGPSAHTLTHVGSAIGTPAYMAPEQAAADPGTDHRADIYAFGVLAYEMLAGQSPFHGRSPQHLLAAQMSEEAGPIRERRPDTPPAIAAMVMHCLTKDPDGRPQHASSSSPSSRRRASQALRRRRNPRQARQRSPRHSACGRRRHWRWSPRLAWRP